MEMNLDDVLARFEASVDAFVEAVERAKEAPDPFDGGKRAEVDA